MKWTREQYIELMTFGGVERQMFVELFGPLIGLDAEWRAQGATEDEINMTGFDWDYVPFTDIGNCGAINAAPPVIIEEDSEYRIERDFLGRTTKLCKTTATIPLPMDFPVKEQDDWERIKHHFVFDDSRVTEEEIRKAAELQQQGHMVRVFIPGGWDMARELMGEEQACLAYYLQPDLMHDIIKTIQETSLKVLSIITGHITVDQLSVHEDMAGKGGPLIGPDTINEFIAPYYKACRDLVFSRGTRLFNQDSDGYMIPVLDVFLDCGVNVIHPCEPAAGMDMVEVRKKYGNRLAILGGIDKHVLRKTKADIDKELQYKMQTLMQEGGTVFALDHRIPNGTPLENYRYYVERGCRLLHLPPRSPASRGWARMAG